MEKQYNGDRFNAMRKITKQQKYICWKIIYGTEIKFGKLKSRFSSMFRRPVVWWINKANRVYLQQFQRKVRKQEGRNQSIYDDIVGF